jgi:S1-C subfamily serine protease
MTPMLKQFSDAIVETVNAASRNVVRVEGRDRLPSSGFVWDESTVVTSSHALEREHIRVGQDGEAVSAKLIGRDPGVDVAVLRLSQKGRWPAARRAADDAAQVGAIVLAVGRPGPNVLASFGIVSTVDDGWRTPAGGFVDRYLQTDVVMFPGLSGGPLVDANAEVIGLLTSGLVGGQSIVIPTRTLQRTVESILQHGRVRRGYLGVSAQAVELPPAIREKVGQQVGLLVMNVEPHSPAGRSGLMLGDTLVTLNDRPLRSLEELLASLSGDLIGQKVPAKVVRGGQVREMSLLVGERE